MDRDKETGCEMVKCQFYDKPKRVCTHPGDVCIYQDSKGFACCPACGWEPEFPMRSRSEILAEIERLEADPERVVMGYESLIPIAWISALKWVLGQEETKLVSVTDPPEEIHPAKRRGN